MCNALQRDARHMWEWISKVANALQRIPVNDSEID